MKRRRGRPHSRTRELAAVWCSILAADRATNAWSIKLLRPEHGPAAIRLAWAAWGNTFAELAPRDAESAAARWGRAEAMLRTGMIYVGRKRVTWKPRSLA